MRPRIRVDSRLPARHTTTRSAWSIAAAVAMQVSGAWWVAAALGRLLSPGRVHGVGELAHPGVDGGLGHLRVGLGLLGVVRRGLLAGAVVETALDEELGRGWRSIAGQSARSRRRRLARTLVAPLPVLPLNVQRVRNVSYGPGGRRNRLDVYRRRGPAVAGAPVLIHFHGGHFQIGGKSRECRPLLHRLARQGWVCVSATYRLGAAGRFPNSLIDAKRVICWARSHAAEYGADPSVVIVAGSSAGAHLAAIAALTPNDPVSSQALRTGTPQ